MVRVARNQNMAGQDNLKWWQESVMKEEILLEAKQGIFGEYRYKIPT